MCHALFKSCIGCLNKLSKFVLFLTNFVFFLIGAALTGLSLYVRFTDWARFFHEEFLTYSMVAGIVMIIVSWFGCVGVRTGKKRYLCPYTTFVFACFVLQVVAFSLATNFNGAMDKAKDQGFDEQSYDKSTAKVMNYIRDQFVHVYEEGQCTGYDPSSSAPQATCADASWLASFINADCHADLASTSYTSCADKYPAEDARRVYCACRESLRSKIEDYTGPLSYVSIGFAAFELLLVTMACCLMCNDRKEERQRAELAAAANGGQPLEAGGAYYATQEQRAAQQHAAQRGQAVGANAPNLV